MVNLDPWRWDRQAVPKRRFQTARNNPEDRRIQFNPGVSLGSCTPRTDLLQRNGTCKHTTWNINTRWFKYERDKLWFVYTQSVQGDGPISTKKFTDISARGWPHFKVKIHRHKCKGMAPFRRKNSMFHNRTSLPVMTQKKKPEALTILSSQIKTKNHRFYNFISFMILILKKKTKFKLSLRARKYTHIYIFALMFYTMYTKPDNGREEMSKHVAALSKIKALC
jgi:hypothetical protein